MQKVFINLFLLFLAIAVIGISVVNYVAGTNPNFQVLGATLTKDSPTPTPTTTPKVDYYLAYPGTLPDHPLYVLKMIRDRISLILTRDPVKKAEKMLLYADKRLGAAKVLIEGNKVDLGVTTLTKAEKYLEQAADQALKAKKAGKDTGTIQENLKKASLKHEEVITELSVKVSDQAKPVVLDALKYPKEVNNLLSNGGF